VMRLVTEPFAPIPLVFEHQLPVRFWHF
jgi:hypothetical protein